MWSPPAATARSSSPVSSTVPATRRAAGTSSTSCSSPAFQEQIPLAWFVFPANETVDLPPEFADHTVIPDSPAAIEPRTIESNRETWITEWEELMEG